MSRTGINPALTAIRTKRGLAKELGERLGISRNAVSMWKRVPPRHALTVAEVLKLPVHIVCPEVFPPPPKPQPGKTTAGV